MLEECSNISSSTLPYPTYYFYIPCSTCIIILSTLAISMILGNKKFYEEKEYIVIAANLFHELFHGIYYLFSGINKLSVYLNNVYLPYWNRYICFAQMIFVITVLSGSGLVALSSAIDRLLAVSIPIRYIRFSRNYAIFLTVPIYMTVVPIVIVSFIITSNPEYGSYQLTSVCEFSGATYPIINQIVRFVRGGSTFIGLLLYVPILWKLKQIFTAKGDFKTINKSQRRNLIRCNLVVCAIVLTEMFLTVIPDMILIFAPNTQYRYFLISLTLFKGLVNVVLITFMLKDPRKYYYQKVKKYFFNNKNSITFIGTATTTNHTSNISVVRSTTSRAA